MRKALLLLLSLAATANAAPNGVVIPGKPAIVVQPVIETDGVAPAKLWNQFLDRLLDHFDRDRDGKLDRNEVSRLFELPMPGRKTLKLDFMAMDANRDGLVDRDELGAYCDRRGYGPVVVEIDPPSSEDARLGVFFRKRTDAKKKSLLDQDLNDDERIDRAELLAASPTEATFKGPLASYADVPVRADLYLKVQLGEKSHAYLEGPLTKDASLWSEATDAFRLSGADRTWIVGIHARRMSPDLSSARDFLIAQFRSALGDQAALNKIEVDDDSTLTAIQALFPYADRDDNGRLTLAELEAYLALVELGLRAQVWVKFADRGHNLFSLLDLDANGRLDVRELASSASWIASMPRCFVVTFAGPTTSSFGGVALPAVPPRPVAKGDQTAPRWFEAMDRNGDGWISPREFLGAMELFRKMDADGDGLISASEARK